MTILPLNIQQQVSCLYIVPEKLGKTPAKLVRYYLTPLPEENRKEVRFCSVFTPDKGALKKSIAVEEIQEIFEYCETYGITNIIVTNADYLKFLLEAKKKPAFEILIGSVKEIVHNGITYKIIPQINANVLAFAPNKINLLNKGNRTITAVLSNTYTDNTEEFINTLDIKLCQDKNEVKSELKKIINSDYLTLDIETTGLDFWNDDLLTISFSKDDKSAVVIGLHPLYDKDWESNRKIVKSFIENYKGRFIAHNSKFDLKFLIYKFWMKGLADVEGSIKGANYFKGIEDTMVMAYLCYNNVDRPDLGLKKLAFTKFGDYDKDIEQTKLAEYSYDKVGKYNGIDTIATFWVFNQLKDKLIEEQQEDVYIKLFKPTILNLLKMELVGVIFDTDKMLELDKQLADVYNSNLGKLKEFDEVKETVLLFKEKEMIKRNAKLKTKQLTIDDIKLEFNPKSSVQVNKLLYDVLGLEVLETTDTGNPSSSKDTLQKLLNFELEKGSKEYEIVEALFNIAQVKTVRSSFTEKIPKIALTDINEDKRIYANFNLGKVVSGRLSSSGQINLTNYPASSDYGKPFKKTMITPKGFILGTVDFSSLNISGASYRNV